MSQNRISSSAYPFTFGPSRYAIARLYERDKSYLTLATVRGPCETEGDLMAVFRRVLGRFDELCDDDHYDNIHVDLRAYESMDDAWDDLDRGEAAMEFQI